MTAENQGVTETELKGTVSALNKMISLKNVPQKIFDVFQKVFMIERPDSDTYWPNELHVPGTMVFAWDWLEGNKFEKPWDRLMKKEIIQNNEGSTVHVSTLLLDTKRGAETAYINNIVFKGPTSSEGGNWYPVDSLPANIIDHHKTVVFEGIHDFVGSVISGHYSDQDISNRAVSKMVKQITKLKRN
jgi:hypothetical protein